MQSIPTPTIREILQTEFLTPQQLSVSQFAQRLSWSPAQVDALMHDYLAITPELSQQLGGVLGVSELYFWHLQQDIDQRNRANQHD